MKILLAVCFLLSGALCTYATSNAPQQDSTSQQAQPPKAANSDVAPTQTKIDPVKAADIQRLMDVAGTKAVVAETMNQMEANMRPMLVKSLPPGDYRDKLIDLFFERFRSKFDMQQFLDMAAAGYDKYLSDEDIKGLIQFYQTPLGQKTLTVVPKLTVELQMEGMRMGQQAGRESMTEVLNEHPDLARALQQASAAPPSR